MSLRYPRTSDNPRTAPFSAFEGVEFFGVFRYTRQ